MSLITPYIDAEHYRGIHFLEKPIKRGEYERCTFTDCRFAGTDLSGFVFVDCRFEQCDLSNVPLKQSSFRSAAFKGCKMLGLHFEDCNPMLFSVDFEGCQLQMSTFHRLKLKGTRFVGCRLGEVSFTDCDLTKADFNNSELHLTHFDGCTLEQADFRTASGLQLDPDKNRLKGALVTLYQLPGLLEKYQLRVE